MASMENRLQLVEGLLRAVINGQQTNADTQAPPLTSQEAASVGQESQCDPSQRNGISLQQSQVQLINNYSTANHASHEDTVDGMGIITFADESKSGHFGPSSNSAFFSHIAKALATDAFPQSRESSRGISGSISRPPSPPLPGIRSGSKMVNPYILPPRSEIMHSVNVFFSITGNFFPYIHQGSMHQMIDELDMTRSTGVRRSSLCLLNALLAIGTSLDVKRHEIAKSREAESDIFFQRALALSPWNIANTTNLETLQALAVMTQYLQGSSKSAQTWRLHGLLVQAAFQLGVHSEDTQDKFSAIEKEIRRRTWYTCVVLDRTLSLTFGRPPLIHNEFIQVQLPIDVELDDLLDEDERSPRLPDQNFRPSSCGLFIASIKLYRIQGDIIREIYNQNISPANKMRGDELFSLILKLDYELTEWKTALPPSLQLLPMEVLGTIHQEDWAYSMSQTVLTLRYLSVRLLLFRKLLENCIDMIAIPQTPLTRPDFPDTIANNMVDICVESASNIIVLIRTISARLDLLPSWWFTCYYLFNAALIIFGAICVHTGGGHADTGPKSLKELVDCLGKALESLEIIGKETRLVRRCSKYLRKMIQVSNSFVRNLGDLQILPVLGHDGAQDMPSVTDGSTQSPLETDFGQFLIDDDFNFLDVFTDMAHQSLGP